MTGPRLAVEASAESEDADDLRAAWDQAWLKGARPEPTDAVVRAGKLRVMDLFAGCGAMSLGLKMAAEALGLEFESVMAADFESSALDVYRHNLEPRSVFAEDIQGAVSFQVDRLGAFKEAPVLRREEFRRCAGKVDVLIGGPPCQGHSDLNNHSRRDDPKNSLYLVMPAMAIAVAAPIVIIENVPAVIHDRNRVVQRSAAVLARAGYSVWHGPMDLVKLGVAQTRRRHVLVAVRGPGLNIPAAVEAIAAQPRSVKWAIADLQDRHGDSAFDTPSTQVERNRKRIDWLFDKKAHDLPDPLRPTCHRTKVHSYVSMYGRMWWTKPAQTLTSGFGSPGQGRFVHATRRRTLTPHEAARIQFFPDAFRFRKPDGSEPRRTELAVMIGNAVPPKLSYVLALAAIAAAPGFSSPNLCEDSRRPSRSMS